MKICKIFKKSGNMKMEDQIIKIKIEYAQYKKEILAIQDGITKETEELSGIKKETAELKVIAGKAQEANNLEDLALVLQRIESNEKIVKGKEDFINSAGKTFSDIFRQLEILGSEIDDIQNRTKAIETRKKINSLHHTMRDELSAISARFDESLEESEARLNAIDEVKKIFQ